MESLIRGFAVNGLSAFWLKTFDKGQPAMIEYEAEDAARTLDRSTRGKLHYNFAKGTTGSNKVLMSISAVPRFRSYLRCYRSL